VIASGHRLIKLGEGTKREGWKENLRNEGGGGGVTFRSGPIVVNHTRSKGTAATAIDF